MKKFNGKIFYMLLGIVVFTTITVIGDTIISSSDVAYDDIAGDTEETTVEGALDELYTLISQPSGATGPTLCYDSECTQSLIIPNAASSDILAFPTPTKDGYLFLGWYDAATGGNKLTSSTTISENTTVYAHWGQITSFANDSWEVIVAALKQDRGAYAVGSTRTETMNLEGSNKDYVLRLANTSTPEVCSTSGYSQTACGVVIEFIKTIGNHVMNSSRTNTGGWAATAMRSYLNTDDDSIYSKLPDELKSVIIPTKPIVSGSGSGGSSPNTNDDRDKLYLLSAIEVGLDLTYDNKKNTSTDTRILDYYNSNNNNASRRKYPASAGTTATYWWLRTAMSNTSYSWYYVGSGGGGSEFADTNKRYGVAPAFRILP